MDLTLEVQAAVEEVKAAFPDHEVGVEPDGQGGGYLVVQDMFLGDQYAPSASWVGFQISFQYPRADVYPHFVDGSIARVDGRPHDGGFSVQNEWRGRRALQISRRSNRWDPAADTAASKLMKVLEWVRAQ